MTIILGSFVISPFILAVAAGLVGNQLERINEL